MSKDAGIEPRTVATSDALTTRLDLIHKELIVGSVAARNLREGGQKNPENIQ
jgi:hypothetical protein